MSSKKKSKKKVKQKANSVPKKPVESVSEPVSTPLNNESKEENKIMANVKKPDVPCILDAFPSIGKLDKRRFLKLTDKMGISEEELLGLAIKALVSGKIKFETKKIYVTA